jgi:enamine deaminase RidA (YjgF/YER057c/UK114 family)
LPEYLLCVSDRRLALFGPPLLHHREGAANNIGSPRKLLKEIIMRPILIALVLTAAGASTEAIAGARQEAKVLMAPDPASLKFEQDWGFSDAIVTCDTIYLSGVVAGVRDGETDLKIGYTRAFERIGEILKNAGAGWDDVVEITSFHTDLTTQMPAIVAVKNNYVKPPFPAWTAIQVSRLIPTNGITEIKIVAKLRKKLSPSSPGAAGVIRFRLVFGTLRRSAEPAHHSQENGGVPFGLGHSLPELLPERPRQSA